MRQLMVFAPEKYVAWMSAHTHRDRRFGYVYRYHPRSDAHSVALCTFVWEDLLGTCPLLRAHAESGRVVCGINVPFTWPNTGKRKTLDLAIGPPAEEPVAGRLTPILKVSLTQVSLACEAKSVMTEHGKSQPRVYDELSSSHEIVHQGDQRTIATGITIVNICDTFVSPLRQTRRRRPHISQHKQPSAAASMVQHLRGLPIREEPGQVGFDAYATIVVSCDNRGAAVLWTEAPAPQPGDKDHYGTFVERVSRFYPERFGNVPS
jgi:hypothetical protein